MEFKPILEKTYNDWWANLTSEERDRIGVGPNIDEKIEEFINNYINNPSEFINSDLRDLDYANDIFNGYKMPEWITDDYMEID